MVQGNKEQIFLQLKCSLDIIIVLGTNYKHFYTDVFAQSSENHLFPLPETEDGEHQPEGLCQGS
jgi:hypothetical protein